MKNKFLISVLFLVFIFAAMPKLGAERPCSDACVPDELSTCGFDAGGEAQACGGWKNYTTIPSLPPDIP